MTDGNSTSGRSTQVIEPCIGGIKCGVAWTECLEMDNVHANLTCHKCKEKGHIAHNCPKKKLQGKDGNNTTPPEKVSSGNNKQMDSKP